MKLEDYLNVTFDEYMAMIFSSALQKYPHYKELVMLRRTIGRAMWLDSLERDEFDMLWEEIVPYLVKEAKRRGKVMPNH